MAGSGQRASAGGRRSGLKHEEDRERPVDILADRARQLLTIQWADGHQSAYSFEYLRWNCPCASCAGEWGIPGSLATTESLSEDQVTLVQVEPVGLFGIRPYWKDGHDTGIYGLKLLRAICPCEECAARRPPATAEWSVKS